MSEGTKLQHLLQNQVDALLRARKAYEKAFKESEKAVEQFQKADADLNLSRAEVRPTENYNFKFLKRYFLFQVEKHRTNMAHKSQLCDSAKNDYADQLQRTNELQRQHYRSGLPEVFRQLQDLDEKRIKNIKNFIYKSVEIEKDVFPIITTCLDGIVRAADIINEKEVSNL